MQLRLLKIQKNQIYSKKIVSEAITKLIDLYKTQGRLAASIVPKIVELDGKRVDLVFEIDEGPLYTVKNISFVGNKIFSDRRLKEIIATKQTAWWRFITSSDNEETYGIIIIPITTPAASADSVLTSNPIVAPLCLNHGPKTMAAKNPYTTVGMPASISNSGLIINLVFGFRYSAVSIALNNPNGPASNTAIMVINIVPHIRGINPNCPLDPTLSALKAVCGDHVVLKKKSCGDTSKKNFTVSYAKLAMIAKVIKIVNQLHILKKFFKKSNLKKLKKMEAINVLSLL